jgi:hypothetical protein
MRQLKDLTPEELEDYFDEVLQPISPDTPGVRPDRRGLPAMDPITYEQGFDSNESR